MKFQEPEKLKVIGFHLPDEEYGYFSNWYRSPISMGGEQFSCVEQYMMFQKVRFGQRHDLADAILHATDPSEMKWLAGKESFKEYPSISSYWDHYSYHIVKRAVYEKFRQNRRLGALLLKTGNAILCECSASDKKWGIGINLKQPGWQDVTNWNGQNYLGRILMEVRGELALQRRGFGMPNYCDYREAGTIPQWRMTGRALSRNPLYYDAVHSYFDQLKIPMHGGLGVYHNAMDATLKDIEESMRFNMGGGLPISGFYEMKQEVYEMAKHYDPKLNIPFCMDDRLSVDEY